MQFEIKRSLWGWSSDWEIWHKCVVNSEQCCWCALFYPWHRLQFRDYLLLFMAFKRQKVMQRPSCDAAVMQQDQFEQSRHMIADSDKTQTNLTTHGDALIALKSILMTPYLRSNRLWKHVSYAYRSTVVFTINRWLSLHPPRRLVEMVYFSLKAGLNGPGIQIRRNINVVYHINHSSLKDTAVI